MATDWSARTKAIAYFEKATTTLKRVNDDDKEMYEQALNALRRSQDHTAIQNRLREIKRAAQAILDVARDGSGDLCLVPRDRLGWLRDAVGGSGVNGRGDANG